MKREKGREGYRERERGIQGEGERGKREGCIRGKRQKEKHFLLSSDSKTSFLTF